MLASTKVLERINSSDIKFRRSSENTLIQLPDGRVAGLNSVSVYLLDHCDGAKTAQEICESLFDKLLNKNELNKAVVIKECMEALEKLIELDLVCIRQSVAERVTP